MSRVIRFSSAAVGMVLLAGLAYYQGHPDPTMGQEDILIGTAIDANLNQTTQEEGEKKSPDCGSKDLRNETIDICAEPDGTSG